MNRKNIFALIIIAILLIGIGISYVLYEEQQVKIHLINANNYHTQVVQLNGVVKNDSLSDAINVRNNLQNPLLIKETSELQLANTTFASPEQKQYINAAMIVNQDNIKLGGIATSMYNDLKNGNLASAASQISLVNTVYSDDMAQASVVKGIVTQNPNQFGFTIAEDNSTATK